MKKQDKQKSEFQKAKQDKKLSARNAKNNSHFFSKEHLSMLEQRVSELKAHKNSHAHELIESSFMRI